MYFTNEEKEIIRKISLKPRYSINDFFEDNFPNRIKKKYDSRMITSSGWNNFGKVNNIDTPQSAYVFTIEHKRSLDLFISIWSRLNKENYVTEIDINRDKIMKNFIHFSDENEFNEGNLMNYENFLFKELIVIQENLHSFIIDNFKTKDEIHMEKALKSADNSFKVSVLLAVISIGLSVWAIVKDNEVKVNNLNEIKIERLEKQLDSINKELIEIKELLGQKKK